jgi:hypothetical protein
MQYCEYCGEPHLCGQLPNQHTSKPVYVVVDNSYTVTLICIHNCVQKYTSVYLLLSTNLLLVCLGYFHTGDPDVTNTQPNSPTAAAACAHQAAATTANNSDRV